MNVYVCLLGLMMMIRVLFGIGMGIHEVQLNLLN